MGCLCICSSCSKLIDIQREQPQLGGYIGENPLIWLAFGHLKLFINSMA